LRLVIRRGWLRKIVKERERWGKGGRERSVCGCVSAAGGSWGRRKEGEWERDRKWERGKEEERDKVREWKKERDRKWESERQ